MPQYSWQHPAGSSAPAALQAAYAEFLAQGPCLSVEIHVPDIFAKALADAGKPIPPAIAVRALLDSGATRTAIDDDFAPQLGLRPIGSGQVMTPSGTDTQQVYGIKLEFPGTNIPAVPFIQAFGAKLKAQGIGVLIGRDFLMDKVLIFNGPMRLITLCF